VGNFHPADRARFFERLSGQLRDDDWFLLGCDLVKDPKRLVAAYDDARGVTAAFNRNVLSVINQELDADFNLEAFAHVALWDAEHAWIEMRLRSLTTQEVTVRDLELQVSFTEGEEIRTEISAKFTTEVIERELSEAGFATNAIWTDADQDFALVLARPHALADQPGPRRRSSE
jgi:L-histidine N-alpha-methyltransferase